MIIKLWPSSQSWKCPSPSGKTQTKMRWIYDWLYRALGGTVLVLQVVPVLSAICRCFTLYLYNIIATNLRILIIQLYLFYILLSMCTKSWGQATIEYNISNGTPSILSLQKTAEEGGWTLDGVITQCCTTCNLSDQRQATKTPIYT